MVGASALFITAMMASTAHDLWTARQATEQRAEQEMTVLARVMAEQTRRSLLAVDVMLGEIAEARREGQLPPPGSPALQHYLLRQSEQLDDVSATFLAAADGTVLGASTALPPALGLQHAPRDGSTGDAPPGAGLREPLARWQAGAADATAVGRPVRWTADGRWQLPLLHRLPSPEARFGGLVGALLDTGYFDRFYADVQLGAGNVVVLAADDGTLVARHPARQDAVGVSVGPWGRRLSRPGGLGPPRRFVSRFDGVERLAASQAVPGYALHVIVERDVDLVFQPWRAAAWGSVVRTALLCAAALGLLAVLLRQLRRLETARASLAESERALRVSDERYALAVAGANEGLWDWDLQTDLLFFSPRAQQACGLAEDAPLQPRRRWIDRLPYHPQDREALRTALVDHLSGRVAQYDVELRVAEPNGHGRPEAPQDWRWVRQRGLAVRDAEGRPRRMAGSLEDITERKRAERQREQLEVRLRTAQKLEAMGTLAGGIAHDFNNILGAILGYGELAQAQSRAGSTLRQQLDGVMSAGLRAKSLVQRILAFSRSGLGEKLPVHVQSVVDEALDLLTPTLPPGVTLQRDLRAGDAALIGDPTQIHQVVSNLGTNALQASRAGTVCVTLAPRTLPDAAHLTSGEVPAGEYLALVVSDPGTGIEPGQIERIFDPFFTTKAVGVGTGLGLSLVHGIVAELQGAIDVSSQPGRGSTFTVLLPWDGQVTTDPRLDLRPEEALATGEGQCVLVVDDEPALVALAEETLATLGYEPVGFTSSVQALHAFEQDPSRWDALLTDETMPQLTGTQLAQAVRRLRPQLPVLLMTGFLGPALAARAREVGVNEVLAKPLVARDIARALASVSIV